MGQVARHEWISGLWRRGRRAGVALEFALVCPVFVLFMMAIFGVGLGGLYQLSLDDSVRDATRQIQIAGPASQNGGNFVAAVCHEFGVLAANCTTAITYNVQANVPPADFASLTPLGMPASGALPNAFPSFSPNSNILVQVAYPLPFTLPYIGKAITFTGTNSILATTTARMEPHG